MMQHGISHTNNGKPKFHICKGSYLYLYHNIYLCGLQYRNVNPVALLEYYTSECHMKTLEVRKKSRPYCVQL